MANGLVNWNGFDLVDLTYTYEEGMPVWPTHPHYFANPCEQYETGWYFNQIILGEHNGTHIDSPGHHVKEGPAHYFVDKLDINRFFGTARILDVYTDYGEDYELKVEQVKDWEAKHGEIQAGDMVFIRFGMDLKYGIAPNNQPFIQNWGGVGKAAAEYLVGKGVSIIGTDALSIDVYDNPTSEAHGVILNNEVYVIENLVNLDKLPPVVSIAALPLKFKDGSGSPIRVIAFVPKAE